MEYYLVDLERTTSPENKVYWKPGARGYTSNKEEAGIYSYDAALEIATSDMNEKTVMLPKVKRW